jgi:hypothetical protein
MKQKFTLLFTVLLFAVTVNAQDVRYIDDGQFSVSVESDVVYGVNATVLFIPQVGEAVPQQLLMDVYTPDNDTETSRPAVLVFHTGNFLPPVTNAQIAGQKIDSSAVEICTQLARRGYVACSVDYRLGWNPLAQSQPERALGLIQAAYRGIQDGTTAVRFLKETVENGGNPYGINPDQIVVLGTGTGGYITLGMAGLNNFGDDNGDGLDDAYAKIINTQFGPAKFVLDTDADGTPETPMVVPTFHGDVEGKALTVVPADGFGLMMGDTTNYPNHVDQSSAFALAVNIGGALGDASWLDEESFPTISIQHPNDQFAPYIDDVLVVPTTGDPIVRVQGSLTVANIQDSLGNQNYTDVSYFDPITDMARANAEAAGHDYVEGLFPFLAEPNSAGLTEGVVIDWWDENAPAPGQGMGIPWNMLPHPLGGTFHSNGLILNEGMSAEKARGNIDLMMGYLLPRMCVSLGIGECGISSNQEISQVELSISPNPASGLVTVTAGDNTMERISITDIQGKVVFLSGNLNTTSQKLDVSNMTAGMYIIQIKLEDGIASSKLMVN